MNLFIYKIFSKFSIWIERLKYNFYRKKYTIAPTFRFNGKDIVFYGEGTIICKNKSYIGSYSTLHAKEGYAIEIGEGCQISHNVRCYTTSNIADQDFKIKPLKSKSGNITIGNYVWIGANVFINPGITIGDNAVIGANSVVTKNVEENGIYAGVPAKLIRFKSI